MKNLKIYFVIGILSLFHLGCSENQEQPSNLVRFKDDLFEVAVKSDLVYGNALNKNKEMQELNFDLYEPKSDNTTNRPMIIVIHGGGFVNGDKAKDGIANLCSSLTKKGFVTTSIEYRLGIEAPNNDQHYYEAVWRAQQDLRAAVRFARANASELKIDVNKIFVCGSSAGAVTCLNVAYLNQNEAPSSIDQNAWGDINGTTGSAGYSDAVAGVISLAGGIGNLDYIQSGNPPVAMMHSQYDATVPYTEGFNDNNVYVFGSLPIYNKTQQLGIKSVLKTIVSDEHAYATKTENINETTNFICAFLYDFVK